MLVCGFSIHPCGRNNGKANRIHLPDIGANASAEEAEEALDDTEVKVNNIVHSFRLQSTSFDKKSYLTYLKGKLITKNIAKIYGGALG